MGRTKRYYEYKGEIHSVKEFSEIYGIKKIHLYNMLRKMNNNISEALMGCKKQEYIPNEEYNICSYFGCGKRLTITESLYGARCINHPK